MKNKIETDILTSSIHMYFQLKVHGRRFSTSSPRSPAPACHGPVTAPSRGGASSVWWPSTIRASAIPVPPLMSSVSTLSSLLLAGGLEHDINYKFEFLI